MQQVAETVEEQFPSKGYGLNEVMLEQTFFPLARDFSAAPSFFRYYEDFTLWDCWSAFDTGELLSISSGARNSRKNSWLAPRANAGN